MLFAGILFAQDDELKVRNYGIEDGLSQRDIFKIQQDKTGFLWVSTRNGIDRFDGHEFIHWYSGEERNYVPASSYFDLILGPNNNLWGSRGNILVKLEPSNNRKDTILAYAPEQNIRLGNLCIDGLGKVWTTRFNLTDSTHSLIRISQDNSIEEITALTAKYTKLPLTRSLGLVYVATNDNEIWVYNLDGKQVKQYEFPTPTGNSAYSRIIELQTDSNGDVWALLDHGQLYYLPADANTFIRHPISDITDDHFHTSALLVCPNKDIWMGGLVSVHHDNENDAPCSSIQPGASLIHYNSITGRIEDHSYFLKQVLPYAEAPRQIYLDGSGVIWISTPFGLIHMVENDLFERYMSEGNDCCKDGVCSMRGMTEDNQGNIYFTYYNSIHVLNPRNGSLFPLFSKQIANPFTLLFDKGHLWTGNGIKINIGTSKVDTIIPDLNCAEGMIMKDSEGLYWLGCDNRLVIYNPENGSYNEFEDQSGTIKDGNFGNITFLTQGKNNKTIWVATREKGIFKINKSDGIINHFDSSTDPKLPHNRILALEENNGKLWIGSAAGLGVLDLSTDSIIVYKRSNGLPNNFINGLLTEGDSAIWVSTDNGLSRLDIPSNTFANFFKSDGLTKNEFNRMSFYKSKEGRMYFGGIDGVNAFFPSARYGERQNKMKSPLVLSKFVLFDGEHDHIKSNFTAGEPIVINPHDEAFTFFFSLADYTEPDVHLYCHMLEGRDKTWTDPSPLNFIRYVNMKPGKYKLRIKASRGGNDWVNSELVIPVVINEAFYNTGWFRIVAVGLAVLLIYGFMQYRFYIVKKHEQELETLVQERTRELESEKAKSDELLLNILPAETAEELKQYGAAKARRFNDVTVMFTDFKGFSFIAKGMEPEALVAEIDHCFRGFDEIMEEFDLEKIKTIGDAYLCCAGLNDEDKTETAVRVIKAGLKIQSFLSELANERKGQSRPSFEARIGIHSGPVVSGIVGSKKFAYDIWGETVNISERLQANGEVGKINISKSTFKLVKEHFNCIHRGKIPAKHQGDVDMYFVDYHPDCD